MEAIIYFILGLILGIVMMQIKIKRLEKENKVLGGIEEYNKKVNKDKEEKKGKILELIKEKGSVKNNDIERAIGVSDATATRYMEELVKEGKVERVGNAGAGDRI